MTHRTTAPPTPSVPLVDSLFRLTVVDIDGASHTITIFPDDARALCEQLAWSIGGVVVDYES